MSLTAKLHRAAELARIEFEVESMLEDAEEILALFDVLAEIQPQATVKIPGSFATLRDDVPHEESVDMLAQATYTEGTHILGPKVTR